MMITKADAQAISRHRVIHARAAAFTKLKTVYERYCLPKFDSLDDEMICQELGELAGLIADYRGLSRQQSVNGIS